MEEEKNKPSISDLFEQNAGHIDIQDLNVPKTPVPSELMDAITRVSPITGLSEQLKREHEKLLNNLVALETHKVKTERERRDHMRRQTEGVESIVITQAEQIRKLEEANGNLKHLVQNSESEAKRARDDARDAKKQARAAWWVAGIGLAVAIASFVQGFFK